MYGVAEKKKQWFHRHHEVRHLHPIVCYAASSSVAREEKVRGRYYIALRL